MPIRGEAILFLQITKKAQLQAAPIYFTLKKEMVGFVADNKIHHKFFKHHPPGAAEQLRRFLVKLLLETSTLAGAVAQIVQLGPANVRMTVHFDILDTRRVPQECTLNTDPIAGDAPHGEVLIDATIAHADHDTFEFLHTFVTAFFNA
jgi:hypothetical protein